jgi:hypothetical protein
MIGNALKPQSIFSICVIAITLTACGTPPVIYTAPQLAESKTSQIVLMNSAPIPVGVTVYKDALNCSGPEILALPSGVMPNKSQVITVEKGKPFTVSTIWVPKGYRSLSGGNECTIPVTFLPNKGSHTFVLGFDGKSCTVAEATPVANVPIVKREFQIPFSSTGQWCKPLSSSDAKSLETQ